MAKTILPPAKPKLSEAEFVELLKLFGCENEPFVMGGIRGYYSDSMGKPGNNRGIYDDAIFLRTTNVYATFNGNTDPSVFRPGIACLETGVYRMVRWMHRGQYKAFQIVRDRVKRDNRAGIDEGRHGINLHAGGLNATWSEGCQTLPKPQFLALQQLAYSEMQRLKISEFPYILTELK